MRKTQTWVLAAAIVVAVVGGVTGCGGAARTAAAARDFTPVNDEVLLRVQNNSRADVKVLVVDGGEWRSIGFVGGGETATFNVPGLNRTGAPLQILATPLSGPGAARSGPLTVLLGQTVTFTIETDLDRSFAVVR